MERLPVNILLFHQQMKAKDLEEVFKHEAEPVFSRSPITGRCAYDLPGMVKPPFIRRKTPALAGMVDDPSSKSDIVGQPRIRCPTRQGLVDLQRANLESIIRERQMMKGMSDNVDGLAAAAMEMARRQGKDGPADDGIGALEALRRLREVADQPSYTEVQADHVCADVGKVSVPGTPSDRRVAKTGTRREPSATVEDPPIPAKSSASDLKPVTPFSKPATPRSGRTRTPQEELPSGTNWSASENQSTKDMLASTPSKQRKMAPPAQKAWKKDSSPSSRSGSKDERWESTWKDVFAQPEERPSTTGSVVLKEERPISVASHASRELRPSTAGTGGQANPESEAICPDVEVSREFQEMLPPVREVDESDETNSGFLAALGIPPATPHTERRAYFLEGCSPRRLPPLSDGTRNRWRRQPPQVMILETPPQSGGVAPVLDPPSRADVDLGHFDPGRQRLKDHHPPSTWPAAHSRVDPSPKLRLQASPRAKIRDLPKQPQLPKNKPAGNFYVGGKPIFASK